MLVARTPSAEARATVSHGAHLRSAKTRVLGGVKSLLKLCLDCFEYYYGVTE